MNKHLHLLYCLFKFPKEHLLDHFPHCCCIALELPQSLYTLELSSMLNTVGKLILSTDSNFHYLLVYHWFNYYWFSIYYEFVSFAIVVRIHLYLRKTYRNLFILLQKN